MRLLPFDILDALGALLSIAVLINFRRIVRRYVLAAVANVLIACAAVLSHRPLSLAIEIVLLITILFGLRLDLRNRVKLRTRALIDYLDAHPEGAYGLQMCRALGVGSGALYPLLTRLQNEGAVRSWWDPAPVDGQPRRRLYGLAAVEA